MKLIVGLGNPGRKYERTPHNAGFLVVDELAERIGAGWKRSLRFKARFAKCKFADEDLVLVKPQTYMNLSGTAVSAVASYFKAAAGDVIVVLDDADLEKGRLRVRPRGSSGGHRGLESVLQALGGRDIPRVRVGIGRAGGSSGLIKHVLRPVSTTEFEEMRLAVDRAADAVTMMLEAGTEAAMNEFNARPSLGKEEQENKA